MELDKQPGKNVEELGDVTQAKIVKIKPSKPRRYRKPLPAWVKKLVWVALLLALAAGSFYAGWKLTEDKDTGKDNTAGLFEAIAWTEAEARARVPRTEVAAALYNDKAYVIGGYDKDGNPQSVVEIFDPVLDGWSDGPALPEIVNHTTATVFEGKIFVVGGYAGASSVATEKVYLYNGDSWAEGPKLPEPIGAHASAVLDNRLYVVGGTLASGETTDKVFSIGIAETEWREETPMNTPRNHLTVAAVGGKLFAIGGRDSTTSTMKTVEVYDPAAKRWTPTKDLLTGRSGITSAVLGGKIYVFGGESSDKTFTEAEEYDPAARTWTAVHPMLYGRHGLGSVVFNETIYLFLGGPRPGLSVSDNVQILEFIPKE